MQWETVIGLEVHTQLTTQSKIFSGASTAFGAEPNTQACQVDIALPGVLPVLNKGAVERAIRFGLAIGARLNRINVFDRKNYFYPDLPKGYQISQFTLPIVEGGALTIQVGDEEKTVRITRAHLEEDAGKSLHEDFHGLTGIDLNRAGTPLLEIVSEPDMRSAKEAVAYAKALHTLVTWIGTCDGNLQEGSFRCDANVSVRRPGGPLGTRREIKNLNSFRFLEQAIDYEIRWQIGEIEDGRAIQQATVLFDPDSGETRMMRTKEDAHDYRYFPDPDLLPVKLEEDWIERVRASLPELPQARQTRYRTEFGLSAYDAATLTSSRTLSDYFETVTAALPKADAKLAANWVMGELSAALNRAEIDIATSPIGANRLARLLGRLQDGTLSGKLAKQVFEAMWTEGGEPDAIIEAQGLKQMSDSGEVERIIDTVLAANQKSVEEFRAGKDKAFNALVGQVMKATKGKANPAQVNDLLRAKLAG
ncbi:MAG: aspartyl/glutamyl-tRNA amidotransferase subunit B [Hydrogenophilaceae bacterium CG1_02_62_390]|nr:Asp-tRNA(Asn)/Glu-tRNA(Gln) amidotransferase subunit GatB [Betaproteobacteria bacterium]OIO78120.1 MAG: aspartyl/glutamyl-tRNA amidotransferase subunit B [Hydrogenophilaceae bacterium CG1_02_62_390]PIW38852.1 MAG: Asp-tRNA(Asn)/Glu-tRNA(Gln) amidotransferase GatCAB subunit B [Hydrogenophilales bacterium CG15_BIG_FIL_POST_REV_8_21_14_020_62_31]PIW72630.1 MAG: Asp-tRNA(Asn)/Glu-tRNA(Gln) amidotransferase GatCAB subunit B [Hydrogenophilales bacterium CG12_big_fil_rev_8_21_14_0_65_61_21]PIX00916